MIKMCKRAVLRRKSKGRPRDDFSRAKAMRNRMLDLLSGI